MALAARHPPAGRRPGGGPSPLIVTATRAGDIPTTGVFCDFEMFMESATGVAGDSATPVDWQGARTTDTVVSVERRVTFVSDTPSPAEWFFTIQRDAVVPLEWLGSTVILADADAAIEWRGVAIFSPPMLAEWRATFATDVTMPASWLRTSVSEVTEVAESSATILAGADAPINWNAPAAFNGVLPAEWRGSTISDATTPIEILAAREAGAAVPAEPGTSTAFSGLIPVEPLGAPSTSSPGLVEWRSIAAADAGAPTEWRASPVSSSDMLTAWTTISTVDDTTPISWGIQVSPTDISAPLEFVSAPQIDAPMWIDWRALISPTDFTAPIGIARSVTEDIDASGLFYSTPYRDNLVGVNWTGPLGVVRDAEVYLDWSAAPFADIITFAELPASARRDGATPTYWSTSLVRDNTDLTDVSATTTTDVSAPIVWTSVPVAAAISSIAWSASLVTDVTLPSASSLTRIRDDGVILEFGITLIGVSVVPAEWGGAAGIVSDITAGIEYRAGQSVDSPSGFAWTTISKADTVAWTGWLASVTPIDYAAPLAWAISVGAGNTVHADWSAPAFVDIAIPLESGGLISQAVTASDSSVSFEFGSTTLVGATAWIDWPTHFIVRHTKGATLEVHDAPQRKVIAEGSGTKGATLER